MMKYYFSIMLFISILFQSKAQELSVYIPDDATFVASFNAKNWEGKLSTDLVSESQFYERMVRDMKSSPSSEIFINMHENPEKLGVSWSPQSFIYVQKKKNRDITTLSVKITDVIKFEKYISEKNEIQKNKQISYTILNNSPSDSKRYICAWTKKSAIIMLVSAGYPSFWNEYYSKSAEEQEEIVAKYDKEMNQATVEFAVSALTPAKNSIAKNANFQLFTKTKCDIGFWVNIEKIGELSSSSFSSQAEMYRMMNQGILATFLQQASGLYSGYLHGFMDMNAGEAKLKIKTFMPDRLDKFAQKMHSKKQDEALLNYLSKDALVYGSVSLDVLQSINVAEEYGRMKLEGDSLGGLILAGWEVLDIIIDQEEISNVFSGNVLVQVTGFQALERNYYDYNYDEVVISEAPEEEYYTDSVEVEEYVAEEETETEETIVEEEITEEYVEEEPAEMVEKTEKYAVPIGSVIVKIGNKNDVLKIIKMLEMFKTVKKEGNYYIFKEESEFGKTYLKMANGMLILTNDTQLITGKYKNGVPTLMQLATADKNIIRQNNNVYHLDIPKYLNAYLNTPNDDLYEGTRKDFGVMKKHFKTLEMKGFDTKNKYEAEFRLSTNDEKTNILKILSLFFSDMN